MAGRARRTRPLRVVSWNVNGLRAAARKGFLEWMRESGAHVVGVQEVRARAEELPAELAKPRGFHTHFSSAERKGYSGVGLYSKIPFEAVETSLGHKPFDVEGRVQLARIGALTVANVYFPNGNGQERDNSRVPFKLRFYRRLFRQLAPAFERGEPMLVMGDFNTAHEPIDLARPKQNVKTSGFLPEERKELARWLKAGWVDTFRHVEPGAGHYTWWSQRFGVREKNIGWRIDYILASPAAMAHLIDATIHPDVRGSDHCPIGVRLDRRVLG